MRLVMLFRRPFIELEEALCAAGCQIDHEWRGQNADALVFEFCDAVRKFPKTWVERLSVRGSIPLVAIARDAPWHKGVRKHKLWFAEKLKLFDIYATHSLQQAERFGRRTLYLPNAAHISRYNLGRFCLADLRVRTQYEYQISFVGNIDAEHYPEHRERLNFLLALRERLARENIRLALIDTARGLDEAEQVRVIQSSQINLNYGAACDQGGEKSWGLPERCYGIPACGGFLLCDRRQHAAQDFEPETEWVDYTDLDSCVARIRHFLANPGDARDIAEAAYKKVVLSHTYRNRAESLISFIAQWKKDEYA